MPAGPWEKVLVSWGKRDCCLRPIVQLQMVTLIGGLMTWASFFTSISSSASLSSLAVLSILFPTYLPISRILGFLSPFLPCGFVQGSSLPLLSIWPEAGGERSCLYWGGEKGDRLVTLQELSLFGDNMEGCMADKKHLANVIAFHFLFVNLSPSGGQTLWEPGGITWDPVGNPGESTFLWVASPTGVTLGTRGLSPSDSPLLGCSPFLFCATTL